MFEIKNLSMIYDMESDDKLYALDGINLELPDTGLVGIIGPSGSGKSTLMYCMSSLKKPSEGVIKYNDKDITSIKDREREVLRRKEFGFVFQKHYLVPYMSALDNILVAGTDSTEELLENAKPQDGDYISDCTIDYSTISLFTNFRQQDLFVTIVKARVDRSGTPWFFVSMR